jgi:hypothetical protein
MRHTTSPKEESFPSKETLLLGGLESREIVRERERVVSLWMFVLQLE